MSLSRLLVFTMGRQVCQGNQGICPPDCKHQTKEDQNEDRKCKLYLCSECGGFIEIGMPTVRVIFKATDTMAIRQTYLYGRGMNRKAKEVNSFVTYHKDCYLTQHRRWIDEQLAHPTRVNTGI